MTFDTNQTKLFESLVRAHVTYDIRSVGPEILEQPDEAETESLLTGIREEQLRNHETIRSLFIANKEGLFAALDQLRSEGHPSWKKINGIVRYTEDELEHEAEHTATLARLLSTNESNAEHTPCLTAEERNIANGVLETILVDPIALNRHITSIQLRPQHNEVNTRISELAYARLIHEGIKSLTTAEAALLLQDSAILQQASHEIARIAPEAWWDAYAAAGEKIIRHCSL